MNESAHLVRKAKAKARTSSQLACFSPPTADAARQSPLGTGGPTGDGSRLSEELTKSLVPLNLPRSLSPASDERAMGFFFTYSILSGSDLQSGLAMYGSPIPNYALDSHLVSYMQTVGLGALVGVAHSPRIMTDARTKYIEAIRSTDLALRSSMDSKEDSGLLAVALLTTFETTANGSYKAWAKHVEALFPKVQGVEI